MKWTSYHIWHNGVESCFLEEFLVKIQSCFLFLKLWSYLAVEMNFVSHMTQWYGIMFSWRISGENSVFISVFKTLKLLRCWNEHRITCHNGIESYFLKEFLMNQVLFSVWSLNWKGLESSEILQEKRILYHIVLYHSF